MYSQIAAAAAQNMYTGLLGDRDRKATGDGDQEAFARRVGTFADLAALALANEPLPSCPEAGELLGALERLKSFKHADRNGALELFGKHVSSMQASLAAA